MASVAHFHQNSSGLIQLLHRCMGDEWCVWMGWQSGELKSRVQYMMRQPFQKFPLDLVVLSLLDTSQLYRGNRRVYRSRHFVP